MTDIGAFVLAVVCEADVDRRTATGLADRVLCTEIEWIEPEILDGFRKWEGLAEGSSHLEWHQIKDHARAKGLKAHGHFKGEAGAPDAYAARLALLLLNARPPDAVVLVRDTDGQEKRRLGLEQARTEKPWPFPVVLAVAHPKRESWVLAGFEPRTQGEEAVLAQLHQELGFDPRLQAEALSAKTPGALRDAKRVLRLLIGDDHGREQSCWIDCPLEELSRRGQLNGLAEYLEEVRTHLVPLFTGREARS
ncbi:MAG TPA: hypothetical protein VN493_05645 [Thermoanaerobaculia bacterium]|nr:hypothetical protein [Thermoanaerobaculia bacterium]